MLKGVMQLFDPGRSATLNKKLMIGGASTLLRRVARLFLS